MRMKAMSVLLRVYSGPLESPPKSCMTTVGLSLLSGNSLSAVPDRASRRDVERHIPMCTDFTSVHQKILQYREF